MFFVFSLKWLAILMATSPIWGAFIWETWEGEIRPRLIPKAEIRALAAEQIARHGQQAGEIAFNREVEAWRRCDSFTQKKWKRIRLAIQHQTSEF